MLHGVGEVSIFSPDWVYAPLQSGQTLDKQAIAVVRPELCADD